MEVKRPVSEGSSTPEKEIKVMTEKVNDLNEVTQEPTFLEKLGFIQREENTTDALRWVWYERIFNSSESQLRFIIQVEFEMYISDNPDVSYNDNVTYSCNRVYQGD